ncbi:hypothetical protein CRYUN_Cryun15aG0018200 [Craigia yunnanensis]
MTTKKERRVRILRFHNFKPRAVLAIPRHYPQIRIRLLLHEKMATDAEINPEPIALVKTEEESKHLTLELCDKVVEFLPGDLKKFQGEPTQPAETNECLAKSENMQVAGNNGVETMNTVSEGNPEISKGESFLISPEISEVANETCGMSEHTEVDDTPFKAEKIAEDEEKMANDKKLQLEEEAGTGENEAKGETEDRMEKGDIDHGIEELNLDTRGEKRVEVEVIADQYSSLEEKHGSIAEETSHSPESENEGTKTDENADKIESDKQVLGIQEANLELRKQALIDTPDPTIDSLEEANETVTEASNSNLVQEELEEKSFKEVKDTEPEKLLALMGNKEGTEATEPIEISGSEKDQIIYDSIGDPLTSTVAESSEIKDHETTSEISEVAKKELRNPYDEVACVHESASEVDEKLEEVSSIIIKDKSQATIESSEEIKDITGENDGIQDKNVLDASSVMKTEELFLQEIDNRDMCNIASDIRTENTVEESPTEESGQSEINEKTEQDLGMSSDICKDYANSESEKVGAEAKVVQATDKALAMTEASDEMKRDEESTVPMPEGNISEVENIDVVQQIHEGKPENEEILKESFQQQNEPKKEKPACPLNAVYEDANTTISSENAKTSTSIRKVTSVKDHEERFKGEGMEDTPTNTDAISKDAESKEKDLQIEVNENTEIVEVEISNKNADDLYVADSLVGPSVESIKEDESSPMKSIEETTEETTLQNLEETAEPNNNDPSLLDIEKEPKEEKTVIEAKEDLVRSITLELEESKKDPEEETSVKGSINTADLDSASPTAETEETNIKEAKAEETKKEIKNVLAVEENGLATIEQEGIGVDNSDIDVKPVDSSTTCEKEKEKEIPQEEDGMQDKVPNAGSEDQMDMTTRDIPLKERLGDEVKEYPTIPSEEYEPTPIEERKITDETSEKDQAPDEHSEIPVSQATDET